MEGSKKPKILNDKLMDQLCKLPDLLFSENLDTVSKAKLVFLLNALDDSADYINEYLTDANYSVQHSYPDISDSKH